MGSRTRDTGTVDSRAEKLQTNNEVKSNNCSSKKGKAKSYITISEFPDQDEDTLSDNTSNRKSVTPDSR